MRDVLPVRRSKILLLAVLVIIGTARPSFAQGFVSPFLGYNFGGDASCPEITNCEDKHSNYGVAFGALGSVVGFEAEFGHTSDFRSNSATLQATNVLTFMTNFMLAPKFGPIQPYGLAGVGLMRTSVDSAGANTDENQIGYDLGGGLIAFFSSHVGVRGDLRYFHSFQVLDLSKFPNFAASETKLDFGRVALAVVFKF
jgi:opacity protein-like surface antigen